MEERRLLLAVALSLVVLTVYQMLVPAPPPRTSASPAPPATIESVAAPDPSPVPLAASSPTPVASAIPRLVGEAERRVELVSQDVEVAFTNRGARVLSWRLLQYPDGRGRPEEMVRTLPEVSLRPLDIETGDPELDRRLQDALFATEATTVRAGSTPARVSFRYAEGDVEAEKTLELPPSGYLVRVSTTVRRAGRPVAHRLIWGPGVANPSDEEKSVQGYVEAQAAVLGREGVERRSPDDLEAPWPVAAAEWLGIEGRYFTALFVPAGGRGPGVLRGVGSEGGEPQAVVAAVERATSDEPVLLFVGPMDHHLLSGAGHQLARVVPVGDWIGPIVLALLSLLRRVNAVVGNYGWSIVVLTLIINLLMAPLRHYSIANGLKMAKLAPEMRVIQERYRKIPALDPRRQEMQREIGELYARHGMSMGTQMLVGCLPILITMPFLIAFYRVLSVSIDLRGADWLWIPDLSQRDPLFLTPILMGASMFLMQKMMPTTMDAAQQKVMLIMPVVLTVMFFAAPAGLNLYWLASNVCSIVQQGITLSVLGTGKKA